MQAYISYLQETIKHFEECVESKDALISVLEERIEVQDQLISDLEKAVRVMEVLQQETTASGTKALEG